MNLELTRNEDINEDAEMFTRYDQKRFIIEKLQTITSDLKIIKEDLSKMSSSN